VKCHRNEVIALLFAAEAEDPAAQALFWVSTWVDYTDKYGFGYQLCDDSVAVAFNDGTKLVMLANEKYVHSIKYVVMYFTLLLT
jgi:predicted 3-demethylubiquinone-9 3-methyltransferase (glyoxalase superfamily)